jgi:chemotaxis signal transduction protein
MLMLRFQAGDRQFGLPAHHIVEVLPLTTVREAVEAGPGVIGSVDYEGSTIPLVDVSMMLCGVPAKQLLSTRIVVMVDARGPGLNRRIALVLERAIETLSSDEADVLGVSEFDPCVALASSEGAQLSNPTDQLLDRPWSGPLRQDWPLEKQRPRVAEETGSIPVIVFRAGAKYFAIRLSALDICALAPPFHTIPFRSSAVLLGVGNVGGEFVLCMAAAALLENAGSQPGAVCLRLSAQDTHYALFVAEIKGLYQVFPSELGSVPAQGVFAGAEFRTAGLPVSLIDETSLIAAMQRLCSQTGDAA